MSSIGYPFLYITFFSTLTWKEKLVNFIPICEIILFTDWTCHSRREDGIDWCCWFRVFQRLEKKDNSCTSEDTTQAHDENKMANSTNRGQFLIKSKLLAGGELKK